MSQIYLRLDQLIFSLDDPGESLNGGKAQNPGPARGRPRQHYYDRRQNSMMKEVAKVERPGHVIFSLIGKIHKFSSIIVD